MKEKILKAIDKGLMNVLSTDIEDRDITFGNNDIDNEYMPEITLDELYEIFIENNDGIFRKHADTKSAMSLILENDVEISLCEYEKGMNPLFLKISNDALRKGGNEMLIYIRGQHLTSGNLQWEPMYVQVHDNSYFANGLRDDESVAEHDFSGYENTRYCIKETQNTRNVLTSLPAMEYCNGIDYVEGYEGYLPAMGQMKIVHEYLDMINYVMTHTVSSGVSELACDRYTWWTSTENSYNMVWCLADGTTDVCGKMKNNMALPMFKKRNR